MSKCEGCGKSASRVDADRVPLCDACYYRTAADALHAQLAESTVHEVQLREALERAVGPGHRDRLTRSTVAMADRALAAPPSTAAAELVALRAFFDAWSRWALSSYVCTDPITRENLRTVRVHFLLEPVDGSESWEVGKEHDAMIDARDALAAVAAARAGTP